MKQIILSVRSTQETVRVVCATMELQRPCRLAQYAQEPPTPEEVIENIPVVDTNAPINIVT